MRINYAITHDNIDESYDLLLNERCQIQRPYYVTINIKYKKIMKLEVRIMFTFEMIMTGR